MNVLFESLLVGIYACFIYLLFFPFVKNFYLLLLVCGFCKHLFSFFFDITTWYCNNGEACVSVLSQDQSYEANSDNIIFESFIEALLFVLLGSILTNWVRNELLMIFLIGVILHITFESIGIHRLFCKTKCEKKHAN